MTAKIALTIAVAAAVLSLAAAAAPAQAASRLMYSSPEGFQFRCEAHGGVYGKTGDRVSCQTVSVAVSCQFTTARQAACDWPGIENQLAVIRVIGTLPINVQAPFGSNGQTSNIGGGNKSSGIQGPQSLTLSSQMSLAPSTTGSNELATLAP